jgi:hypothetical protein
MDGRFFMILAAGPPELGKWVDLIQFIFKAEVQRFEEIIGNDPLFFVSLRFTLCLLIIIYFYFLCLLIPECFAGRLAVPQSGNLFGNRELEFTTKIMLLRRVSMVIFSGIKDQYLTQLPVIQERLVDALKSGEMRLQIEVKPSAFFSPHFPFLGKKKKKR